MGAGVRSSLLHRLEEVHLVILGRRSRHGRFADGLAGQRRRGVRAWSSRGRERLRIRPDSPGVQRSAAGSRDAIGIVALDEAQERPTLEALDEEESDERDDIARIVVLGRTRLISSPSIPAASPGWPWFSRTSPDVACSSSVTASPAETSHSLPSPRASASSHDPTRRFGRSTDAGPSTEHRSRTILSRGPLPSQGTATMVRAIIT